MIIITRYILDGRRCSACGFVVFKCQSEYSEYCVCMRVNIGRGSDDHGGHRARNFCGEVERGGAAAAAEDQSCTPPISLHINIHNLICQFCVRVPNPKRFMRMRKSFIYGQIYQEPNQYVFCFFVCYAARLLENTQFF